MLKAVAVAALVASVIAMALMAGSPRQFTDPMTHRDGGWLVRWGPVTCAVWTWSDPDVQTTGLPVNCSTG